MANNTKKEFIKNKLLQQKGLITENGVLKKGYKFLADKFECNQVLIKEIIYEIRKELQIRKNSKIVEDKLLKKGFSKNDINNVREAIKLVNYNKIKDERRLIIGDLHAPFILEGYLEWCEELKNDYKCNKISFTGDIIDGSSWSYHESDADGMSVGDELYAAKKQLKLAYKMFPEAEITLGNHDLLIARKARTAGLSQKFIRDLGEILEAPKAWNFSHEFIHNNVRYIHGSIGNAFTRAKDSRMSTVQGHLHSQSFIQYSVSEKDAIFGMQLGAGIDRDAYAFEYAKPMTQKPVISAGLVLENGQLPILRLMKL